ncbi:receptor-like protein 54 [Raphanus sativus]|uniref:Receptor-like protein 54 n=1 Tax=Raphanus sativus TaxID=3726 RepID=A0A6J0NMJ7_RAPSA|nr:receptor-like protein 54 [Raphanus sativus]
MMALRFPVFSFICYFFFCVFALSFIVTTIVSQPYRRPDQIEILLAFKDEFTEYECNDSVASSWIRDAISFDGVVFDSETGVVTKLDLRGGCLSSTLGGNSSLFKFHYLRYLDLSYNKINPNSFSYNNIYSFLAELDRLVNLESLDLSNNDLVGKVPSSISNLSRLTYLDLSSNDLNSRFPLLYNLTKLSSLDLSNNRLEGKVPEWLWNLPSLTALSLSHNSFNSFQGSQEEVFLNSSLVYLYLTSNAFHGPFPKIPETMRYMVASNNDFTGEIPLSLCNPRNLSVLDLSNNNFSGSVPSCLSESLTVLNLRDNKLRRLPDMFYRSDSLKTLDVGHNQITGKLPRSLLSCTSLEVLNVESNRMTDTFPSWLKSLPNLQVVILRSNGLYGPITYPPSNISFPKLRIIDISSNNFTGSLPPNYFLNWNASLVNVPEDHQRRPQYMGDSYSLGFQPSLYVTNKGLHLKLEKILRIFRAIDFSGNRLEGQIPESIGLLKSLHVLDLSNNRFKGYIPSSLGKLINLESLDLSRNQVSGKIPQEIASLNFLEYINMSYNKLTGPIPQSTQIIGQQGSSFEGNVDLCGLPLEKSCFGESCLPTTQIQQSKSPKQEQVLNWKAAEIGYGLGVVFGIAIGQVIATYKPVLFFKLFRL